VRTANLRLVMVLLPEDSDETTKHSQGL